MILKEKRKKKKKDNGQGIGEWLSEYKKQMLTRQNFSS